MGLLSFQPHALDSCRCQSRFSQVNQRVTCGDQWGQQRSIFGWLVELATNFCRTTSSLKNGQTSFVAEQVLSPNRHPLKNQLSLVCAPDERTRRPGTASSSGFTLRRPGRKPTCATRQPVVRDNRAGHVPCTKTRAHCRCQGRAAAIKDVLQPPKTCCSCQRRVHVLEKADPYNTIMQTTNQVATLVQSSTNTAEYQVVAPQIQTETTFQV